MKAMPETRLMRTQDINAVVTHRPTTPTVPGRPQTRSRRPTKNVARSTVATKARPMAIRARRARRRLWNWMRPLNRQRSRNQYTCAHRKSSRRGTATASRKTLNTFKWGTLTLSFYHPAGAKPGLKDEHVSAVSRAQTHAVIALNVAFLLGTGLSMMQRPIWDVTDSTVRSG